MYLISQAIAATKLSVCLHVVKDGEQAVHYFDTAAGDRNAPGPALVILDINLPRKQGGEVLKYMRSTSRWRDALVIAISTSDSTRDRAQMMELGANGYFRKPSDYAEFMKLGDLVKSVLQP